MTEREQFMAMLSTQPLLPSDAVVVLCGEDGLARAEVGAELMRQEAAPVLVLSGGLSRPDDGILGAKDLAGVVMGKGVAPSKLLIEDGSQNTSEQAHEVICLATERGWKRLLLVASPYHIYRAFLTFLGELHAEELDDEIHLVAMAANQVPWFERPPGATFSRSTLLGLEMDKIEAYTQVADYHDGVAYLSYWEGR